jgi:uncharacterized protein (TIRG00374 family)
MKNYLTFFIKAVVSIGLIWYLLSKAEFTAVYASLKSAQPFWLLMAFITLNIGKLLTGYRWQILLEVQGIKIPLRSLIASVFVGQFFNSFLPTTIGGDTVRAYDIATQSKESTKSVMSVFVDRLIGVFALALLAIIALLLGYFIGEDVGFYVLPVFLVFFICSFGIIIIYNNALIEIPVRLLRLLRLSNIADKLNEVYQSVHLLKGKPRILIIALIVSIVLQINVILFYYFIGVALDLGVSFLYFSLIVPVALIVLLVPFSINGIGIREGIFVFLMTELGVLPKDAIALSWISFGLALTQGIIGGIIFALRGSNFRSSQIDHSVTDKPQH